MNDGDPVGNLRHPLSASGTKIMLCSRSGFLFPFQSSTLHAAAVNAVRKSTKQGEKEGGRVPQFHNKESLVNRYELPQLPLC
jgi:hypothetical protein